MPLSLLWLQGRWLAPNVYTVPLGPCDVDWHIDRGIVAVACVGQDMIKVWPLPVEQPGREDGLEEFDELWGQCALTRGEVVVLPRTT
jgi:hypothetical protein